MDAKKQKREQLLCTLIARAAKQVKSSAFFIGITNALDRKAWSEALDELELAGKYSKVSAEYWAQLKEIAELLGLRREAKAAK